MENMYFCEDGENYDDENHEIKKSKITTHIKFKDISGTKRPVSAFSWQKLGVSISIQGVHIFRLCWKKGTCFWDTL